MPMMQGSERIGFIGMGEMGRRMAMRLVDAGYRLTVYNRTRERAKPLAAKGATVAEHPQSLAATSEIVLSSLADDAAVEEMMFGPKGALTGGRPGTIFIEMSTISPKTVRRLSETAAAKKSSLLDAPVSGSTPQAETGNLMIFVGGSEEVNEFCAPIFDVLGKKRFYLGANGNGAMMKLVVNTLLGVGMQAVAEAVALGEKCGLEKGPLLDVLNETSVISPGQKMKLENARMEEYPVTFPLRLMLKDFRLILSQAMECAVSMPMTAVAQSICAAENEKGIEEDYSAVIRLMEALSGVDGAAKKVERRAGAIH